MIILIGGASHTGKTVLAQRLLEKYKFTYLSIDHLKMGLIRSKYIDVNPEDDEKLKKYLWPVVREIIKTAAENKQNLIVEGIYIPFNWKDDFDNGYLKYIRCYFIIMTNEYIKNHFKDIKKYASVIENRLDDTYCSIDTVLKENEYNLFMCKKYGCNYILIENEYNPDIDL